MIQRSIKRLSMRALIVDDELGAPTAEGRAARALVQELQGRSIEVIEANSAEDGTAVITADTAIHAVLLDWTLGDDKNHARAKALLQFVRSRNDKIPIFLMAERGEASAIPVEIMEMVDEYIWTLEDTAAFVGGRVAAAIRRYLEIMLPPLAAALMKFSQEYEYSWHTPGHTGGTAFLKSPVGRIFFDYFGENMLRSDLSISVGSLGSLLDHTGPIGEHEKYAARVFGADRTYSVTNGTSMSNRVIFMAAVARDQIALCDRNCHKSIEHSLVMTGAIPTYLVPLRNRYGIIGPIPPNRLDKNAIKAAIKSNPLVTSGIATRAVHSIVTNSTYDGLCYNARRVEELLDPSVDRIHFDEAWYAYARFNPLYRERHAMHGDPKDHKGPTIFATHSTHKLLAALSQASFLHIRDGRSPIPHSRFNESYMLHASTSPLYPIIVSNDITASMMDGPGGPTLTTESIQEAVSFRQTIGRVNREFARKKQWFFKTWNPDTVRVGSRKSAKKVRFEDAPPEVLAADPNCWVLHPKETWHGFGDLEDGYCMLDPIKVSIVTPGVLDKGGLDKKGIPANLVTAYLHYRGVEVEKTTDFTILVLFSIGITKGKWGTLLNALLDFKRDYDNNTSLAVVLPHLTSDYPDVYGGMGLRDLADQMFAQLRESRQTHWLAEAFSTLPTPVLTPNAAFQYLVRDEIEHVPLDKLADRILATSVVPYPPGIPMLMPGESTGPEDGPYLGYLRALAAWDKRFPGFGHDTHGVENRDGVYYVQCLKSGTA
ncbi:arginine decarboxylase [Povalibacter uvarum]|uniref:Arginine decarboxylase n=1 Tax=Povalibacter uvarum TaxID=732238 RepID=A0A841HQX9_9GAMM|nr:Orn/Lys/Arg decarboxylase N-terminal domain-containing protein [Povalibacter uvarum]MBB6095163.1 arginine decarboxylase [Povalibacter uvarum]